MTPPATAAARSASRSTSHRSKTGQRRTVVKHPRRVSGPARSAAVALGAPGIALPRQRPVRPQTPSRRAGKRGPRTVEAPGLLLRASDRLGQLSSSVLVDRVARGRMWIGLLAFALIGIVAMQLFVLELNTGVGRALRREALLQRENAQIGIEDSVASAGGRVEPLAAATGMTIAAPGTLHFVAANAADISRAAAALTAATHSTATGAPETSASSAEAGTTLAASSEESSASTPAAGEATASPSSTEATQQSSAPESTTGAPAGSGESSPPTEPSSSSASSAPVAQAGGASVAPAGGASTASGVSGGAVPTGSQE